MRNLGTVAPDALPLSNEAQQELVRRIVASKPFARAPQLKDFLLFIVERTSLDGGVSINETEIGRNVLRRQQANFDPSTDNIVRVQARHLRHKLDEYFNTEGSGEPVLLTIPKGTYVPIFVVREPSGSEADPAAPYPSAAAPGSVRRWWFQAALAASVLALALGAWWLVRPATTPRPRAGATGTLWEAFARTGRKTSIVLSDSSVSVVQNLLHKPVSLSQYLSPGYPRDVLAASGDQRAAEVLEEVTRHPYTSLNSAIVASRLQLTAKHFGVETALRFPREITIREFESENFLLIGSKRSVPWMELLEDKLNFALVGNPRSLDFYMSNKAPRPGEEKDYRPGPSEESTPTYASIALLPNGNGTGLIMCLQGLTGMANEAAERLIEEPQTSPLPALFRSLAPGTPPRFEILIRATGVSGAPVNAQVIATRVGSPPGELKP